MSSRGDLMSFECAKCGARLTVDGSTQTPTCGYCNTQTLLPEEIWHRFRPPPPPPEPTPREPKGGITAGGIVIACIVLAGILIPVVFTVIRISGAVASGPQSAVAVAGEPCNGRRAACSTDKQTELACGADDKLAVSGTCKGPNGCRVTGGGKSISCDTTLAAPNDPCSITDDACSTDHKAELRCQGGHFKVIATCKGPDGCTLTPSKSGSGYTLSCDDHIADVGDPCFDTERTACSSDKKSFLTCTAQRFVVDRSCKRGCTVKKIVGTGNVQMACE